MGDVISIADFKRREQQRADARDASRPFCGPCWDEHKEIHHLQRHKIWGGDVGLNCPNCGSEFDAD